MQWLYIWWLIASSNIVNSHPYTLGSVWYANSTVMVDAQRYRIQSPERNISTDKPLSYTEWSDWSPCKGGHRTRRKHCIRLSECGDKLRVEPIRNQQLVKYCTPPGRGEDYSTLITTLLKDYNIGDRQLNDSPKHGETCQIDEGLQDSLSEPTINENTLNEVVTRMTRQRDQFSDRYKFRGFSPWSPWSTCSRRCTTVRRRYCRRQEYCGHRVIRQSAYCYTTEGGYCQKWIQVRTRKRQDPGYTVVESLPTPAPPIHYEDSMNVPEPHDCGRIGRYRGSAAVRNRARMMEMLKIIGGRPSAPGKWPWQVAVLNRYKEAFCGGTLVSARWVVTAAHCVRKRLYVRIGEHDLMIKDQGEVEMRVVEAVVHPQYDPDTVINDVAMLRLPEPARLNLGHGVACLPRQGHMLPSHSNCIILGWGKRRPTDIHGTRILHEAQVATINQEVCRRSYWQYAITDDMVCAGRGRRDSCAGDSGGPLLCKDRSRYFLQGITSFGDGCGKAGKYGIYTRTAGYVAWMRDIINRRYFD